MMTWISVEDRLPEGDKKVMLIVSGTLCYGRFVGMFDDNRPAFDWHIIDGRLRENPANVTHWQPLPEPPVSDEERRAARDELFSGKYAIADPITREWNDPEEDEAWKDL